jgi:hypothetical protein
MSLREPRFGTAAIVLAAALRFHFLLLVPGYVLTVDITLRVMGSRPTNRSWRK